MELAGRRRDGSTFPAEISLSAIDTEEGILVSAAVRDVTDRKRAEARRAAAAGGGAGRDGLRRRSTGGSRAGQRADRAAVRLRPPTRLVGQHVEILVPDAVRGVHPGRRAGYVTDPRPRPMGAGDGTGRAPPATAPPVPAEISLSAIDTEEGILVSAAVRDVTDRKRAVARFRGLLEAAPDAVVCVDGEGRIVLVTSRPSGCSGMGVTNWLASRVETLVPDAVRDAHPVTGPGMWLIPGRRPMGAGMELAGRRRDGSTFPAEISLSAIDTDQGILVSAAVRDVTERRTAAETAAQLASIIQSSHDAVIGKTLDQVITSWNRARSGCTGTPPPR